jgi:hypothetical protein
MITRTFHGKLADTAGTSTMTFSNIDFPPGDMAIVVSAYESGHGSPYPVWHGEGMPLNLLIGDGIQLQINSRPITSGGIGEQGADDLTIEWPGPTYPAYRAAMVLSYSEIDTFGSVAVIDAGVTTDPDTGEGTLPGVSDLALLAFTVARGPSTDDLGTVQGEYTPGESIGTNNATAADNVFLHEFYKVTSSPEKPRAYKTGATSRDHLAAAAAYKKGSWFRIGISAGDIIEAYTRFAIGGHDIRKHAFFFNQDTDTWEIWANLDYSSATLVARNTASEGWVDA